MKSLFVKIFDELISVILIDAGHTYDVIPLYHMHVSSSFSKLSKKKLKIIKINLIIKKIEKKIPLAILKL